MNQITKQTSHQVELLINQLKLKAIAKNYQQLSTLAIKESWSYPQYLAKLCELEVTRRYQNRIQVWTKESKVAINKSFATLDLSQLPKDVANNIVQLKDDISWAQNAQNLLLIGPSGVGKSHIAAALGNHLIESSVRVKWFNANDLLQQLQQAKKELLLTQFMNRLDKYKTLVIDDIGYVKKSDGETHVLFEFIAHRYESGSLIITSNQPFSQWDHIFPDSMMTIAAIDRLIHHASVIEIDAESYRKKHHKNIR